MHNESNWKMRGDDSLILIPSYLENEVSSRNRKKNSDIPSWISAIVQVITVLFIIAGYFYTVRPVFQHQMLQEKKAELELELTALDKQLNQLHTEKERSERSLARAIQYTNEIESKLSEFEDELLSARWSFFERDYETEHNRMNLLLNIDIDVDVGVVEYIEFYRENWQSSYSIVITAYERLRESHSEDSRYPASYLDGFYQYLVENRSKLECERPEFENLKTAYLEDINSSVSYAEQKGEEFVENYLSITTKPDSEIPTENLERLKPRITNLYYEFRFRELETNYRNRLLNYHEQCRSNAYSFAMDFFVHNG